MIRKNLKLILGGYLLVTFFLSLNLKHHAFEQSLYQVKYKSIIKDRDFNIVNNVEGDFNKLLTPTDNIGDMHDIGAPILWSISADLLSLISDNDTFAFNLFPGMRLPGDWIAIKILYIFLLFYIRKWLVDSRRKEVIFWCLLFSIGIHDYVLDNIFNADIFAMFFMVLVYVKYIKNNDKESSFSHYELGLLMGILRFIKVTSVFYIPAIFVSKILFLNSWKERIYFTLRFTVAFSVIFSVIIMNNYINIGNWSFLQGYNYWYFWDGPISFNGWKATYLYPRGLFTHSTALILVILASASVFRRHIKSLVLDKEQTFLLISIFGILLKLILPFFCPADHFLALGARQFFIDFPVLFILICSYQKQQPKLSSCLLFIAVLTAVYFNSEWILLNKDTELFSFSPLLSFKENISNIVSFIPYLIERIIHSLKSLYLQPLIFVLFTIFLIFFYLVKKIERLNHGKSVLILLLSSVFISYSFLNLYLNNDNSFEYFQKNGYHDKVIGNGGNLYLYHEINSGMTLGRFFEELYGDTKSQEKLKKIHENYLNIFRSEVIFIGKDAQEKGIISGYQSSDMKFNIPLLETSQSK